MKRTGISLNTTTILKRSYFASHFQLVSFRGEPGGWMIEDNPGSQTHKGTPASIDDIKNLVLLKRKSNGRMVVEFVDEAFNFRPTIRHKVYTLEEAELLMLANQKPKLASALKAQFDAKEHKSNEDSDSEESEHKQDAKKPKKAKIDEDGNEKEEESRAARTLRDVVAVDALIDEIKPEHVEDWEYDEEADDDDLNMGEGDFAEEEQYELEAEHKKHAGSDSSDDELDERGKHLKKLIKKGPTITTPPSTAPIVESVDRKETESQKEPVKELAKEPMKELSRSDLIQFLKTNRPLTLKDLIEYFKPYMHTKEHKHQFIQLVKEVAITEQTKNDTKVVVLRQHLR
eukprot:g2604.t1